MFLDNVRLAILIVATMLLLACRSEGVFSDSKLLPKASLYQIDINDDQLDFFAPKKYTAMGKYDDGATVDISSWVHWVVLDPDIVSIDAMGVGSPKLVGHTSLFADLDGITSDGVELNVVPSLTCGRPLDTPISTDMNGGINDTGKENAGGPCLKVREITHNAQKFFFLATPSFEAFKLINTNLDVNDIRTILEVDEFGFQSSFIMLTWEQGTMWCENLSDINYLGKSNWKIASFDELDSLYSYENPNDNNVLLDLYGWPIRYSYWTEDNGKNQNSKRTYGLSNGIPSYLYFDADVSSPFYVSCVASF